MDALPRAIGTDGHPVIMGIPCVSCSGVLQAVRLSQGLLAFRCRIGHAFGEIELVEGLERNLERRLWSAVVCVEELGRFLDDLRRDHPHPEDEVPYGERAAGLHSMAAELRKVVESNRAIGLRHPEGPHP